MEPVPFGGCGCRMWGSGKPLRFKHWGAREVSPFYRSTLYLAMISRTNSTNSQHRKTRGLYWFGPPLWCNTLLQCGGGGLPLGLMMNNTREERAPEVEAFSSSVSLCVGVVSLKLR